MNNEENYKNAGTDNEVLKIIKDELVKSNYRLEELIKIQRTTLETTQKAGKQIEYIYGGLDYLLKILKTLKEIRNFVGYIILGVAGLLGIVIGRGCLH